MELESFCVADAFALPPDASPEEDGASRAAACAEEGSRVVVATIVRPLLSHESDGALPSTASHHQPSLTRAPACEQLAALSACWRPPASRRRVCSEVVVPSALLTLSAQVSLSSGHTFTFDFVYGAGGRDAAALFADCVAPLVDGTLQGLNATILAYGQTGSGKTHAMGSAAGSSGGVIPLAVRHLFEALAAANAAEGCGATATQVHVTFVELYQEEVRDLLAESGAPPLQLRDVPGGNGAALPDAHALPCACAKDVDAALARGAAARATAATGMNATSSRSHAVLTLHLERVSGGPLPLTTRAKLHLVDLAGSERAKRTGAEGSRFAEGCSINKGLLSLGNVIAALGDDARRRAGGHVPYRDSKLTRLLADALGGNSRTLMLACVSPADCSCDESLNTLKYANRARNIRNRVAANVEAAPSAEELASLRRALAAAHAELAAARRGGGVTLAESGGRALAEAVWRAERAEGRACAQQRAAEQVGLALAQAEDALHSAQAQALDAAVARDAALMRLEALQEEDKENEAPEKRRTEGTLRRRLRAIAALKRAVGALTVQLLAAGMTPARPGGAEAAEEPADDDEEAEEGGEEASPGAELDAEEEEQTVELGQRTEQALAALADARAGVFEARRAHASQQLAALDAALLHSEQQLTADDSLAPGASDGGAAELREHYERVLSCMEGERETLLAERSRLVSALEAASAAKCSSGEDSVAGSKLRSLEAKLAALQRKLREHAAAEASRAAASERSKSLAADIQRMKAARVELVRRMERDAKAHTAAARAASCALDKERRAARKAAAQAAQSDAAARRTEAVLRRKTEEVASAQRTISVLRAARAAQPSRAPPPPTGAQAECGAAAPGEQGAAWAQAQVAAGAATAWSNVRSLQEARDLLSALFDHPYPRCSAAQPAAVGEPAPPAHAPAAAPASKARPMARAKAVRRWRDPTDASDSEGEGEGGEPSGSSASSGGGDSGAWNAACDSAGDQDASSGGPGAWGLRTHAAPKRSRARPPFRLLLSPAQPRSPRSPRMGAQEEQRALCERGGTGGEGEEETDPQVAALSHLLASSRASRERLQGLLFSAAHPRSPLAAVSPNGAATPTSLAAKLAMADAVHTTAAL